MSAWSPNELQFLLNNINLPSGDLYIQYVSTFGNGRTLDSVGRQARRLRASQQVAEAASTMQDVIQEELEDQDTDIDTGPALSGAPVDLLRALGRPPRPDTRQRDRAEFNVFVDDLIRESRNMQTKLAPALENGSSLCILLSDTHIGKLTHSFNREVFTSRILSIADKIQAEMTIPEDMEEIVLMLAGDMLEGEDIYASQSHHLEMPVIDQVQIAVDAIWTLACRLKDVFKVQVRLVTCPGNHGRVSKTASEKSNWDNVIYQTLAYIANSSKNGIQVEVNFESFYTFKVQDKTGMLFHHGTKHLGTPAMQSKVATWIYTKQFDFMCHGHWHEWSVNAQYGKLVMKNGSLPGEDDLSERMGVYNPPRQGWLFVRKGQPINQVGFFEWENTGV